MNLYFSRIIFVRNRSQNEKNRTLFSTFVEFRVKTREIEKTLVSFNRFTIKGFKGSGTHWNRTSETRIFSPYKFPVNSTKSIVSNLQLATKSNISAS
jgi:hypothetical protein